MITALEREYVLKNAYMPEHGVGLMTSVSHASDLLFARMIELARERGKETVNLGLGVNAGIRRFKEKWGGHPLCSHTHCTYAPSRRDT